MNHDIDFPDPPAGYRWRIKEAFPFRGVRVALERKTWWGRIAGGSIESLWVDACDATAKWIWEEATGILDSIRFDAENEAAVRRLVGVYVKKGRP